MGNKVGTVISRWPKYLGLRQWIIRQTPKLDDGNFTMSTRVYWVLNGLTDFPKCKTCGNPIRANASVVAGYKVDHCSNRCAQLDSQIQAIKKNTWLAKYGVEHAWQAECVKRRIENTLFSRYGVKHPLASPEIQSKYQNTNLRVYGVKQHIAAQSVVNKAKQTNISSYGVDNPWKAKEIQDKCKQKYLFEGAYFDSAPEIAFFIWLKDNGVDFEYSPNIWFEYSCNGKKYKYYPDFRVRDELYEIKGDHFFEDGNPSKNMINPYDSSQNDIYESKRQCMLANNVKILTSVDYKKYIYYVKAKYGTDYLKQFKHESPLKK